MKKPLFEINKDSIVKGTGAGNGYDVCTTTPPHPHGLKQSDRNVKYVYLHIAVMEQKLGRYLKKSEYSDVHHIDGDSHNNAPSNLELKSSSEHHKDHAHEYKPWKDSPGYKLKMKRERARKVASAFIAAEIASDDKTSSLPMFDRLGPLQVRRLFDKKDKPGQSPLGSPEPLEKGDEIEIFQDGKWIKSVIARK